MGHAPYSTFSIDAQLITDDIYHFFDKALVKAAQRQMENDAMTILRDGDLLETA